MSFGRHVVGLVKHERFIKWVRSNPSEDHFEVLSIYDAHNCTVRTPYNSPMLCLCPCRPLAAGSAPLVQVVSASNPWVYSEGQVFSLGYPGTLLSFRTSGVSLEEVMKLGGRVRSRLSSDGIYPSWKDLFFLSPLLFLFFSFVPLFVLVSPRPLHLSFFDLGIPVFERPPPFFEFP